MPCTARAAAVCPPPAATAAGPLVPAGGAAASGLNTAAGLMSPDSSSCRHTSCGRGARSDAQRAHSGSVRGSKPEGGRAQPDRFCLMCHLVARADASAGTWHAQTACMHRLRYGSTKANRMLQARSRGRCHIRRILGAYHCTSSQTQTQT